MRKRGLPYVLAAMMLIGSTGIGGNYVRADEPIVTEEGEVETTETDEIEAPTEETTEEVIEETAEEVTEENTDTVTDVTAEETADIEAEVLETIENNALNSEEDGDTEASDAVEGEIIGKKRNIKSVIENDSHDEEDSPVSGALQLEDFEYEIVNKQIVLKKYNGNDTEITIPVNTTYQNKSYKVALGSGCSVFSECISLKKIAFEDGFVFPKDCSNLFNECTGLESIDLSGVNTSSVTNMSYMFYGCVKLKSLDLSSFDMSSVTKADGMLRIIDSFYDIYPKTINSPRNVKIDIYFPTPYWILGSDNGKQVVDQLPKNKSISYKLNAYEDYWIMSDELTGWFEVYGEWIYYFTGNHYSGRRIIAKNNVNGKEVWWVTDDGTHDTSFTGIAPKNTNGHLRFARNGVMDLTFTGLALDPNNHWCFVRDGVPDLKFSGIAQTTEGKWYYCNKGRVDTSFTNMIAKCTNGKYYYVVKGRPTSKFNGIAYCPETKNWYYCTNGRIDFKFSGKVAPCTNGNCYYVTKGRIDYTFTGVAEGTDGKKYYVIKGLVDRTFSGTVTYKGKKYTVVKGVVKQ